MCPGQEMIAGMEDLPDIKVELRGPGKRWTK